jgi:hypothetical protein
MEKVTKPELVFYGVKQLIMASNPLDVVPCIITVRQTDLTENHVLIKGHLVPRIVIGFETEIGKINVMFAPQDWKNFASAIEASFEHFAILENAQ